MTSDSLPGSRRAPEFAAALQEHAPVLRAQFNDKFEKLEQMLPVIHSVQETAKAKGLTHLDLIWNVSGYICVCIFDLGITLYPLISEGGEWRRRVQARQAAIILYEAAKDIPQMLGGAFRESISSIPECAALLPALNDAIRPINSFWAKHREGLKLIRVKAAAHRDQDLGELMAVILSFDPDRILELGMELDRHLNGLSQVLQQLNAAALASLEGKPPKD